jgi:hypothetical protein
VVKVNPATLKVEELFRYPYSKVFRVGTAAIQVGNEIWLGSGGSDRIARFPISR